MASLGDVLRHLVKHAPDLSDDNRAEFLDAVDREFSAQPAPDEAGTQPEQPAPAAPVMSPPAAPAPGDPAWR
jgi:hypothetical protein